MWQYKTAGSCWTLLGSNGSFLKQFSRESTYFLGARRQKCKINFRKNTSGQQNLKGELLLCSKRTGLKFSFGNGLRLLIHTTDPERQRWGIIHEKESVSRSLDGKLSNTRGQIADDCAWRKKVCIPEWLSIHKHFYWMYRYVWMQWKQLTETII